jgi:hypothetical protein
LVIFVSKLQYNHLITTKMKLKYISDSKGITRGVYIPIGDWNALKSKYQDIEQEEVYQIPEWQTDILLQRLESYKNGLEDELELEEAMKEIEKDL